MGGVSAVLARLVVPARPVKMSAPLKCPLPPTFCPLSTQGPPSYRVWGEGEARATVLVLHTFEMHVDLSFSYLRFAEAASFDKKELRRSCTSFISTDVGAIYLQLMKRKFSYLARKENFPISQAFFTYKTACLCYLLIIFCKLIKVSRFIANILL
jgi:hypothetical protein